MTNWGWFWFSCLVLDAGWENHSRERLTTCLETYQGIWQLSGNLPSQRNVRENVVGENRLLLASRLGLHQCLIDCCGPCVPSESQFCRLLNHCEYFCRICADIHSVMVALTTICTRRSIATWVGVQKRVRETSENFTVQRGLSRSENLISTKMRCLSEFLLHLILLYNLLCATPSISTLLYGMIQAVCVESVIEHQLHSQSIT